MKNHPAASRRFLSPAIRRACFAAAVLTAAVIQASAADIRETGRAAFNRAKDAVITVSAVVKVDMSGLGGRRGSESQEIETTGTIIGKDGLLVVSSSMLNPIAATLDNLDLAAQGLAAKPKVDLTQVKYRLGDGTEVPARLVYKDKDLDLAFLVPDLKDGEAAPAFTALELKAGAETQELDDVILVSRLAKHMSYTPAVFLGKVVAVVTKPRTIYDFSSFGTPTTGGPVFNATGELVGFTMVHHGSGGTAAAMRMAMGAEIVILPSSEVTGLVDAARKAAAKKPEAVKEEKPAPEGDKAGGDKKPKE